MIDDYVNLPDSQSKANLLEFTSIADIFIKTFKLYFT